MSLSIDPEKVTEVLLDRWYVVKGKSFTLDAYEYVERAEDNDDHDFILHGGGQYGVCANGFDFECLQLADPPGRPITVRICGPLTAIQAVKTWP